MDHTMTAPDARTTPEQILLFLIAASFACAPVSWIVDGITPSWVVYPIALAIGLWRRSRGGGTLYFGIAATVFLLIHLPCRWAAVAGDSTNPLRLHAPVAPRRVDRDAVRGSAAHRGRRVRRVAGEVAVAVSPAKPSEGLRRRAERLGPRS